MGEAMRMKIKQLIAKVALARPAQRVASSQQVASRKPVETNAAHKAMVKTLRDRARMQGLPTGFYWLPEEIKEKRRIEAEAEAIEAEAARPKWKKKFIPLSKG